MSGEKIVYALTDVEVSGVKGEPDTVVLAMCSGRKDTYFEMKVADLASLAERLTAAVKLLQGQAGVLALAQRHAGANAVFRQEDHPC